jgi:hypothetical protein
VSVHTVLAIAPHEVERSGVVTAATPSWPPDAVTVKGLRPAQQLQFSLPGTAWN